MNRKISCMDNMCVQNYIIINLSDLLSEYDPTIFINLLIVFSFNWILSV